MHHMKPPARMTPSARAASLLTLSYLALFRRGIRPVVKPLVLGGPGGRDQLSLPCIRLVLDRGNERDGRDARQHRNHQQRSHALQMRARKGVYRENTVKHFPRTVSRVSTPQKKQFLQISLAENAVLARDSGH
jgi:hypothetical protein